jgi:hypothetical protein
MLVTIVAFAALTLLICVYMAASFPGSRPAAPEAEPPAVQSVAPRADDWEVDVEVIHAPTGSDWEAAIQKQLDAIEERDPSSQLVAVTTIGNRMVLFYKRRIG